MNILGGILMGAGILITGLSGLCSLVLFLTDITSPYSNMENLIALIMGFGGIPLVIGVGIFFLGRHLARSAEQN